MLYFVQTTRFYPDNFEKLGFNKVDDELFMYNKDKSLWKKRYLLDLGYGKEIGLVRMPELAFDQLISLVLVEYSGIVSEETYNFWGALSILVDDYCLDFLELLIKTFSKNDLLLKHKFIYDYLNCELNLNDDFLRKLSDERVTECCHKWRHYINEQ